jgi:hypothetical protein
VSVELIPVMWVFWAWAAFSVVYFAFGAARSRVEEAPVVSTFVSEREAHARYRELARNRFGGRPLAYLVLANGLGGTLLYAARTGQPWAVALFTLACAWLLYDHATSPRALRELHPRLVTSLDWTYYGIGFGVWLYALACIAVPWLGRLR